MPRSRAPKVPEHFRNAIVGYSDEDPRTLTPHPLNPRTHPKEQTAALSGALTELGWLSPVLVSQSSGRIIDGHARIALAIARNEPTVPVAHLALSEENERLALATYDPIGALAGRDQAMLDSLLADLTTNDGGLADLLASLATPTPKALNEDDADLTPPADPITKPGDLWLMGDPPNQHRLLCGDSTDLAAHERLLKGTAVDLVLTDPPYGVGADYTSFEDNLEDVARLITAVMPLLMKWPCVLLTSGIPAMWLYPKPTWVLAWVHPAPAGSCPWGFASLNPVLAYGADPYLKAGLGRRPDSVVMGTDRNGFDEHPTPKPVAVWQWLLERGAPKPGSVILDPFLGSGTTLVAAEALGHTCFGIELDPGYCDVIVRRWQVLTGKTARREARS